MYEDFIPLVEKPARYINSEINVVKKDPSSVRTRVCLLFPDTYEVGMSHLGLRILYHAINSREDAVCERVFSPWIDYEARLLASGRKLTSLESNLPAASFDILGITLQYELSYSNVLAALILSGIPLQSRDRTENHPIVVAGGPCTVNPGPLSDFIDVFFIGEAEEAVHEMIDLRQKNRSRSAFLSAIAKCEGFFVPALGRAAVRRRRLAEIETAFWPDKPILPLMKPVHDRVTVEIARGCIRGCRFCQAGIIYRPYRERSLNRIKDILHKSLLCTGYEELSLASLSSGDYSNIEPLVSSLMAAYKDSRVSISLPSLRVGTLTQDMIKAIAETRKTGFTLAPEAGTERLRRVINKPISDLDILDTVETVFANGWNVLKLYFMIGLPTETDEDLDGIIRLAKEVFAAGKRAARRHVQLNITVSTFVPKPHTPFQWLGQAPIEEVRRKQEYLAANLKRRGVTLKFHNAEMSLIEAAFARGSQELGKVLEEAVKLGCRMDGWSECFDYAKWQEAFRICGFAPADFAAKSFDLDNELPWDYVTIGVTKEFLKKEFRKAMTAEITGNCRKECSRCGIGCTDGGTPDIGKPQKSAAEFRIESVKQFAQALELTARIRMKLSKTGKIRFLSHLDFMTLFHRTLTRANVPVAYSHGFNPHPKVAFGPPLPVGIESLAEYVDIETDPFGDLMDITKNINAALPDGVRIFESAVIPNKTPSLSGSISRYDYSVAVPEKHEPGLSDRISHFLERKSIIIDKNGKERDLRPGIESIVQKTGESTLAVVLVDSENMKPRIQDVLAQFFELDEAHTAMLRITRTGMYINENGKWKSPMDVK